MPWSHCCAITASTVIEADDVAAVEREAQPGSLLVVAQTFNLFDDELLSRLANLPGDRLLVEPVSATRERLAPRLRRGESTSYAGIAPNCDLPEATKAGTVQFGSADAFEASGSTPVTRCYDGALARYTDDGRTITAVGSARFHDEQGLLRGGQRRARDESRGHTAPAGLVCAAAQRGR